MGRKLDDLHLKDLLKYKCEVYLKQPLIPPQRKIIVAYHTLNFRLAIKLDDGQLFLSLKKIDFATFPLII